MTTAKVNPGRIVNSKKALEAQLDVVISKYVKDHHELVCSEMTREDFAIYSALDEAIQVLAEIRLAGNF